jgi:competence protein ComEA
MVVPELPPRLELPRPAPPRAPLEHIAERVRWFGLARLVVAAASVALVVGGAWWLLSAPAPTAESSLPVTSGAGSTPGGGATLPPPSNAPRSAPRSVPPPGPSSTSPATIVVHVAGAVVAPGVHVVARDARVADAVAAAGGVAPGGDPDGVNLAAALADGQRIYVPLVGEVDPVAVPSGANAAPGALGDASPPSGPVDLNTATVADLEQLPGVGPATAAAIVDDRTRNGPFASVDDLDRVTGIGPAKLAALRDLVTA